MTYPRPGTREQTAGFLDEARSAGQGRAVVSHGGSPDMWSDVGLAGITEYRAGTYAYFDRTLATRGTCGFDDCALTVLARLSPRRFRGAPFSTRDRRP